MDVDGSPQHDAELWFDDGNLVIQAGNSQFLVHRGILSARSPVFKDMLSFPQPPDSELVEGRPLVRFPDSEKEVAVFLKAIFVPEFFRPFPFPTKFDIIVGVLRLSHKYGVEYLRRRALIHLSSAFHTELAKHDKTDSDSVNAQSSALDSRTWTWPKERTYLIVATQLAREVGATWVLPHVLYNLSTWFKEMLPKILTSFDHAHQVTFLQGHSIQAESTSVEIVKFISDGPDGCGNPDCAEGRLSALRIWHETIIPQTFDPLYVWARGQDSWELLDEELCMCSSCLTSLKQANQAARQTFWDKLPEIYGLPAWEELEKLKVEAIGTDWLS
ncbi:hypothetical protein FB45DRAFT_803361 [Roridomyces roridus]|uniref:BTB domain-containing protein n=1 Tax=Roridomyces roridus TaxID=1738132 RepID=A0AAD7B730_9AGAR|nr:hypothetical protein FB45DRAFT_803361 [Roridomyces roridus]